MCVGLSLGFLSCSIDLYFCFCAGTGIFWLSFLIHVEIFLVPGMINDFWLKPGWFGYYVMTFWILIRSVLARFLFSANALVGGGERCLLTIRWGWKARSFIGFSWYHSGCGAGVPHYCCSRDLPWCSASWPWVVVKVLTQHWDSSETPARRAGGLVITCRWTSWRPSFPFRLLWYWQEEGKGGASPYSVVRAEV